MGTAIRYSHSVTQIEKRSCLRYWSGSGGRNGSNGSNRCRRYRCPKVRSTGKPYLLVCNTYRFKAHSMFDAELYRDQRDWRMEKEIPFRHSKLPDYHRWNHSFEQKIEAKVQLSILRKLPIAELKNHLQCENKMQ
jgi:TPP-dependent pyruvate/acetoin dehydrogenase alpha subunit